MTTGIHMEREIREQASVLARNSERYFSELSQALSGKEFEVVLLAARGTSDHAAQFGRYLIEVHLGIPAILAAPSVLTRFGRRVRYPRCLAIGISQSGAAPDVSEVISAMREDGHNTLGITNTDNSRLESEAEFTLHLGAGLERSIAATKTYTTSLLAMLQLVRALGGAVAQAQLPDEAWIASSLAFAESNAGLLVRSTPIFSLGRGYGFSTAQETALKLMECALLPCQAFSTADFEHGPKALARHGSAAVVFGEPPTLESQGCATIVAPDPQVAPESRPLWDAVTAQWLALLAGRARGLDPDGVEHLNKVTETY